MNIIVPCGVVVFNGNKTNNLLYQFNCLFVGSNFHQARECSNRGFDLLNLFKRISLRLNLLVQHRYSATEVVFLILQGMNIVPN